jgi:hypothetical protein
MTNSIMDEPLEWLDHDGRTIDEKKRERERGPFIALCLDTYLYHSKTPFAPCPEPDAMYRPGTWHWHEECGLWKNKTICSDGSLLGISFTAVSPMGRSHGRPMPGTLSFQHPRQYCVSIRLSGNCKMKNKVYITGEVARACVDRAVNPCSNVYT